MLTALHRFWTPLFDKEDGGTSLMSGGTTPEPTAAATSASEATKEVAITSEVSKEASKAGEAPARAYRKELVQYAPEAKREDFQKWVDRYTDDGKFAEGLLELRHAASSRPALPTEKSTPEERDRFFRQLGKPEAPDKYDLKLTREYDDAGKANVEEFKIAAHKLDLTATQAKELYAWYEAREVAGEKGFYDRIKEAREQSVASLKKEWGPDFDANVDLARQAVGFYFKDTESRDAFGKLAEMPMVGGGKVGDHPQFVRLLAMVGRGLQEDGRAMDLENRGELSNIDEQIQEIVEEAKKNKESILLPKHSNRLDALYKKKHPGKYESGKPY